MIERLVAASIRGRAWVVLAVLVAMVLGLRTAAGLRFDAFPDLTNVQVQVLTTSPGMGTEEVEKLVTVPLERALSGAPDLAELRSISRPGVSAITAVFHDHVDLWHARQVIAERVATARDAIPPEAGLPTLAPPSTGLGEVVQFTLVSDRHPRPELYRIFERDVAPRLRALDGVVEVNAWGAGAPQLEVRVDPFLLASTGLGLSDVERELGQALGIASGGYEARGAEQLGLRAIANPRTPEELAEVVLREGPPVLRVGDVARVQRAGALPVGLGSADGQGEALFAMVQLLVGADARSVARDVRGRLAEIEGSLPEGVVIETIYDREKLIGNTLHTVATSLIEGGLLVIVVLLLLLGDLRAGLLVASVIPMSMIGALAGLRLLGFSGNLMSLGAIDFGLVVDGSVVMVEGLIALKLVDEARREQAFIERVQSLARPVLFAMGILATVYLPILALGGTEGRLFRPMALTVLLAVSTALVLALTWVPAVASWVIRPSGGHVPLILRWITPPYQRLLAAVTARPAIPVALTVVLVAASAVVGLRLGVTFVPRLEEGDLVLQTERLPGIHPDEALRGNTRVERALLAFPEVERIATRTGSPAIASDPMGLNESDVLILLAPREQWTTAHDLDGLITAMNEAVVAADPSAALTFTQPIEMRFNEMLEGVPSDVGIAIYGRDLDALLRTGQQVAAVLETLEGAADVRAPSVEGLSVVEIDVRPDRAGRLGIDAADVLGLVEATELGRVVGDVLDGEFRNQVVVRLARPPALDLADLPIAPATGPVVPIAEVADVRARDMAATVRREAGARRVIVQANVRGRDLGAFVREARTRVADVPLPEGSWITWSGKYEQLRAALGQTALVVPLVLLAVLVLLRTALGGLRPALIIFLNVPLAISGGLFALALGGMPISMSAIVGFVALFGISVMNGIVLITRMLQLLSIHAVADAVRLGAHERFRPVLVTAIVAGLGFVPMMLATGVGAEVQRPLATVIVGGLFTSTTLTLIVLPSLCARLLRPADGAPFQR